VAFDWVVLIYLPFKHRHHLTTGQCFHSVFQGLSSAFVLRRTITSFKCSTATKKMARDSAIPPESFEKILAWLNADREIAASRYVQLRHDLAKMFIWRDCPDPEGLTDEVFDRVAQKVGEIRGTYQGDPRLYFRAVANNLIKETLKKIKTHVPLDDINLSQQPITKTEQHEEVLTILEECMAKLSPDARELLCNYYSLENRDREKLSADLAISYEALRVRVFRIRQRLRMMIEDKMKIS